MTDNFDLMKIYDGVCAYRVNEQDTGGHYIDSTVLWASLLQNPEIQDMFDGWEISHREILISLREEIAERYDCLDDPERPLQSLVISEPVQDMFHRFGGENVPEISSELGYCLLLRYLGQKQVFPDIVSQAGVVNFITSDSLFDGLVDDEGIYGFTDITPETDSVMRGDGFVVMTRCSDTGQLASASAMSGDDYSDMLEQQDEANPPQPQSALIKVESSEDKEKRLVRAERVQRSMRAAENLDARMPDHSELAEKVVSALRRDAAGLLQDGSPIATFMFTGTDRDTAKEIANAIAESIEADGTLYYPMFEYNGTTGVNGLLGAQPGFARSEEGGKLANDIIKAPYSVVVFDKVESASADVTDLLVQLVKGEKIEDRKNQVADYSRTIVIFTTDVASELDDDPDVQANANKRTSYLSALTRGLSSTLIDAVDEVFVLEPKSGAEVKHDIKRHISAVVDFLRSEFSLNVTVNDEADVIRRIASEAESREVTSDIGLNRLTTSMLTDDWMDKLLEGKVDTSQAYFVGLYDQGACLTLTDDCRSEVHDTLREMVQRDWRNDVPPAAGDGSNNDGPKPSAP